MAYLWPILLVASQVVFFALTLFGLPGNWLMLVSCITYAAFYSSNATAMIGWVTVAVIAGIVVLAEVVEFFAGAAGIARGGSKQGAVIALVGSILGSLLGATLGSAVPVLGTIVGVILGASLGAMLGAMVGESLAGRNKQFQWEIGKLAFWARLGGAIGKIVAAAIVFSLVTAGVLL